MIKRTWRVMKHEYISNITRPSFLMTAIGLPLFVFSLWGIIFLVLDNVQDDDEQFHYGYVDQGDLVTVTDQPDLLLTAFPDEEAAASALEEGTIDLYMVIGADYVENGRLDVVSDVSITDSIQNDLLLFLRDQIGNRQSEIPLERIRNGANEMTVELLDTNRTITEEQVPGVILAPFGFIFIFAFAVQLSNTLLIRGMVEERTNRIVEVLVTSIRPFGLLAGKLIGLGALGLTMVVLWFGVATLFLTFGPQIDFLSAISFETSFLLLGGLYFVVGYTMLASILLGVGAIANSDQEGNQYAGILNLFFFIPVFFSVAFFEDANGTLPTALTLIPLTAPGAVMMRLAFDTVPTWQILFSIVGMLGTTVLALWVSSRLFEWAMLRAGQSIKLSTVAKVIRGKEPLT